MDDEIVFAQYSNIVHKYTMDASFTKFHLESPPGFQGLNPRKPVSFYHRNLPHWRQEGATYFVTFRLADSLPREKLDQLREFRNASSRELKALPENMPESTKREMLEQRSQKMIAITEKWLDLGMGSCLLRKPERRKHLIEALEYFDSQRYELGSYVVMPNHVHLVLRPLPGKNRCSLEEILQDRKRASSFAIGKTMDTRKSIWQEESYDRIIRDPQHLWLCLQYIGRNPAKAKLGEKDYALYINPDWKTLGWDFE